MREFKIVPDKNSERRRDRKIRLILWSTVLALIGVTVLGILGARSENIQLHTVLVYIAWSIVAGTLLGVHFLGMRLGTEKIQRDLIFVLTDKDLVRRRNGWPEIRIGFDEISSVCLRKGGLVIESVEPRRKIYVPKKVDGFEFLRAELSKRRPADAPAQR